MTSGRMRRVDEAIRQVIGGVVAGELKDPRVGFVTVTDVRTSVDLSHARVYVSVLGDEPEREATLEGLRSAHGHLQRRIASELRLKRTPTLSFLYDDTTDRAMRLEELLGETEALGETGALSEMESLSETETLDEPGTNADE
jgi:ribosome-binding factor A